MNITLVEENKDTICSNILNQLKNWFAIPEAIVDYANGVKNNLMFVAQENGNIIGFISIKKHFPKSYEVYVMGVTSEFHSQGIGSKLLTYAENFIQEKGASFLTVKTLAASRPDKFYDLTRSFYLKNNFIPLEEFKELWDEDNPCLLMVKYLN